MKIPFKFIWGTSGFLCICLKQGYCDMEIHPYKICCCRSGGRVLWHPVEPFTLIRGSSDSAKAFLFVWFLDPH